MSGVATPPTPSPLALEARIAAVRRLPVGQRVTALSEALRIATTDEADVIAPELLELAAGNNSAVSVSPVRALHGKIFRLAKNDAVETGPAVEDLSLAALARNWSVLSPELKAATMALGSERWRGCSALLGSTLLDERSAASISALAVELGESCLAGTVVRALVAGGEAAERALLVLAARASMARGHAWSLPGTLMAEFGPSSENLRPNRWPTPDAGGIEEISRAVWLAVQSFADHRRRGVFEAAMVLLDRDLMRPGQRPDWLRDETNPPVSGLKGAVRWSKSAAARLRAFEWMSRPEFAACGTDRVSRATSVDEHEAVLRAWHLSLRPARATVIRSIRVGRPHLGANIVRSTAESALPGAEQFAELSESAKLGLCRIAPMFKGGAEQARPVIYAMVSDPEPGLRHAAMRALASDVAVDLCFDEDPRVARSAFLRVSSVGRERAPAVPGVVTEAISRLVRSPHRWVRNAAMREAGPARVLYGHDSMPVQGPLLDLVRAELEQLDAGRVLRAIAMARRADLVPRVETELLKLLERSKRARSTGPDEGWSRVAATVIAAVGESSSGRVREVLLAALRTSDSRVRANAVESLVRHTRRLAAEDRGAGDEARAMGILVELKADPHHRVRANAVRAWIRGLASGPIGPIAGDPSAAAPSGRDLSAAAAPESAADGVTSMLTDARAEHRLAGVWLTGRVAIAPGSDVARRRFGERASELRARLGEMARFDADERVRSKALHIVGPGIDSEVNL